MEVLIMATKPGLYANIAAKRERIAAGSKEKMRQPGDKGARLPRRSKNPRKTARKNNATR